MKAIIKIQKREINDGQINVAQGYGVQKISECEALNAGQKPNFCTCYAFEEALEAAGLQYKEDQQLEQDEQYTGYIAVLAFSSSILVFYLDGSLFWSKLGSVTSYSELQATGKLYGVPSLRNAFERGLKHDFLDEETINKALEALKNGNLTFEVSEKEQKDLKGWMGSFISFE